MWKIDKQFSFCYGHRVWTQQLEEEFCQKGDYSCKCRHLHGHEGLVHVFLENDTLERGMVTDFKHLGWLKDFIDDNIDHKFLIDGKDPMFWQLVTDVMNGFCRKIGINAEGVTLVPVLVPGTNHSVGWTVDLSRIPAEHVVTPEYETLEGYMVVDFVPTSENLSKWLFDAAQAKMAKLGIRVAQIDWFETPKSRSSYRG